MSVLSNKSILDAVDSKILRIFPFDPKSLQPASYDMRLHWKILVSPTRYEKGREIDLRKEPDKTFYVEPGRFIGVLTREVLTMPLWISARFGLRSEFTRHGLVAFGGIQVDPGFKGRLAISLFNAGPEAIQMIYNKPMFTVEFHSLDIAAEKGYEGPFQNLRDFHPSQKEFILNAHTASLAEINALPEELSRLRQQVLVHELTTHEPRHTISLEQLAEAQGLKPVLDTKTLLGGWPEDEDYNKFITIIKYLREAND